MAKTFKSAHMIPDKNNTLGAFADCSIPPEAESITWAKMDKERIWKMGIEGYHWSPKIISIISDDAKKQNGVIAAPINANSFIIDDI